MTRPAEALLQARRRLGQVAKGAHWHKAYGTEPYGAVGDLVRADLALVLLALDPGALIREQVK